MSAGETGVQHRASCAWGGEGTGSPTCLRITPIGFRETESPLYEAICMERRASSSGTTQPSLVSPRTPLLMSGPGLHPKAVSPGQGYLGSEPRPHCFPPGLLSFTGPAPANGRLVLRPAPWPAALPTLKFFRVAEKPSPSLCPTPRLGSLPARWALCQPLAAGTQAPIDSWSCFLRHHVGWGRRRRAWGSARSLSRLSMPGEVLTEGAPGAMPLPGCPFPTWVPALPHLQEFLFHSVCPGGRPTDRKHQPAGREGNKGRDGRGRAGDGVRRALWLLFVPSVDPWNKPLYSHSLPPAPTPGPS